MKLGDLLRPAHLLVPLQAASLRDATRQLARTLIASGAVTDGPRFEAVLQDAWPEDILTIGEHAFLPHFRTDAAGELAAALGITRQKICWEKDRHRCARVVILIVAPPREAARYLQAVGALARALRDPDIVTALHAATGPADLSRLTRLADTELPSQLTVRDLMTSHVLSVRPDQHLGEAARLMMEHNVRAVPVVSDTGAVVGILSDRELLRYFLPQYLHRTKSGGHLAPTRAQMARGPVDPRQVPVQDAMSRSVLCLSEDQQLTDVANLMVNRDTDRYPVVREGVVVGFLTRADIVRRLVTP